MPFAVPLAHPVYYGLMGVCYFLYSQLPHFTDDYNQAAAP